MLLHEPFCLVGSHSIKKYHHFIIFTITQNLYCFLVYENLFSILSTRKEYYSAPFLKVFIIFYHREPCYVRTDRKGVFVMYVCGREMQIKKGVYSGEEGGVGFVGAFVFMLISIKCDEQL